MCCVSYIVASTAIHPEANKSCFLKSYAIGTQAAAATSSNAVTATQEETEGDESETSTAADVGTGETRSDVPLSQAEPVTATATATTTTESSSTASAASEQQQSLTAELSVAAPLFTVTEDWLAKLKSESGTVARLLQYLGPKVSQTSYYTSFTIT